MSSAAYDVAGLLALAFLLPELVEGADLLSLADTEVAALVSVLGLLSLAELLVDDELPDEAPAGSEAELVVAFDP
jgi:hypothetical protein